MNEILGQWNSLDPHAAAQQILPCCGSRAWAETLVAQRPFASEDDLLAASDAVWWNLSEDAWQEAFDSHPRIGQRHVKKQATAQSLQWSEQEQEAAVSPGVSAQDSLNAANDRYEKQFGRIFIICALGRVSDEILQALEARMNNDPMIELHEAAEQQRQITQLRLRRWLEER